MAAEHRSHDVTIGVVVGIPAAVGVGALMATARSFFDAANAALVLMIVVVAVAALGGRLAGIITALAAVASFDFFHTQPYLSMTIDSRDDIETTVLLLIAAVLVGTIASAGRSARRQAGTAHGEILRIHRVAEAAATGADAADVIATAQDELRELLSLRECRFEALPAQDDTHLPHIGRNGAIEGVTAVRFGRSDDGRGGFELPDGGAALPVLARGQHIGRFLLVPTPGVAVTLEQRLVAVAIADQVAAIWVPTAPEHKEQTR
jgi:K+-sensing histidine kinase KdpD